MKTFVLGFGGGGAHYCLGNQVAKAELRALFHELLTQVPDIQAGEPTFLTSNFVHAVRPGKFPPFFTEDAMDGAAGVRHPKPPPRSTPPEPETALPSFPPGRPILTRRATVVTMDPGRGVLPETDVLSPRTSMRPTTTHRRSPLTPPDRDAL